MDRGAWRATVHGVTKSQTRLKRLSMLRRKVVQNKISRRTTQRSRIENILNGKRKKADHFNRATLKGKGFTEVYTREENLRRHPGILPSKGKSNISRYAPGHTTFSTLALNHCTKGTVLEQDGMVLSVQDFFYWRVTHPPYQVITFLPNILVNLIYYRWIQNSITRA